MKSKLINFLAVVLVSILGTTACSTTESENVKTSGIWARFTVEHHPDGDVVCWAVLRVGGGTGTVIELSGGEHIRCNDIQMSEYFEPVTNFRWNRAIVPEDLDGIYDFLFVRTDEEINTSIVMPELPLIYDLFPDDVVLEGEALTIYWDDEYPGDVVDINVEGSCIQNLSALSVADSGEYTFDAVLLSPDTIETTCDLEIDVVRIIEDSVNPAYQGGFIEAHRIDRVTIPFEALSI